MPSTQHSLHSRAEDNLQFIRTAMEGSVAFTGISGKGFVFAGVTAIVTCAIAAGQTSPTAWLTVWMIELLVAGSVCLLWTAVKARALGSSLLSASGRRLFGAFIPTMAAGGILTLALLQQGLVSLLPGTWLILYGAAVVTGGAHSVKIIPVMGACFMGLGAITLLGPLPADLLLGLGMGGLHIVTGIIIWRFYGG